MLLLFCFAFIPVDKTDHPILQLVGQRPSPPQYSDVSHVLYYMDCSRMRCYDCLTRTYYPHMHCTCVFIVNVCPHYNPLWYATLLLRLSISGLSARKCCFTYMYAVTSVGSQKSVPSLLLFPEVLLYMLRVVYLLCMYFYCGPLISCFPEVSLYVIVTCCFVCTCILLISQSTYNYVIIFTHQSDYTLDSMC